MGYVKRNWHFVGVLAVLLAVVVTAWAVAPDFNPYGIVTPRLYLGTYGNTHSIASYYAAPPSLLANDTLTCNAATQTLTNKTLTSPVLTGPAISGTTTVSGPATFTDAVTASGGLTSSGTTVVSGTTTVSGPATFTNTVDMTGAVTASSGISGEGAGTLSGFLTVVLPETGDYTLTTADIGKTITSTGASAEVTRTLPDDAPIGFHVCIANVEGYTVNVDPGASDIILGLTNAAGDRIQSAAAGDTVYAEAVTLTQWVAVTRGTWSDAD